MTQAENYTLPSAWRTVSHMIPIVGVALALGVSVPTVQRMVNMGQLPQPTKIGRSSRWDSLDIASYISNAPDKSSADVEEGRKRAAARWGRGAAQAAMSA